jgi:Zn-dependent protease
MIFNELLCGFSKAEFLEMQNKNGDMVKDKGSILQEILEFAVTVAWLGIAFGIAYAGGTQAFSNLADLRTAIIESLVVVFFAFVFHELAHRVFARRYGFKAVYHVWIPGLLLSLGAALFGILFAAPGGVYIGMGGNTAENRKKLGKSALAGPMANIILSIIFFGLSVALVYFVDLYLANTGNDFTQIESMANILWGITVLGVEINAWLAFFNLIPFGNFDGLKVFTWNKVVWGIAFVGSLGLYFLITWLQSMLLGY